MSDSVSLHEEHSSDDLMVDSCASADPAVPEVADTTNGTAEWTGPRCEKCEAPLASDVVSICRKCGWYPSLGRFVELDPDWESEPEPEAAVSEKPQLSHVQVWLNLMPRWAWIVIASVAFVVVESVVARLVTPAGSSIRTLWSVGQLAIGVLAVVVCHVVNFLVLAADDADIGILDLLLKPVKLWIRAAQKLPTRLWVADGAACGLVAAVMSLAVIGGIPYDRLWDWGIKEPPKQNLMGAVMNRVKQLDSGEQSDDLEKSISDFAGDKDVDPNNKPKEPPKSASAKPREKSDCVILGYQLDHDGRVASLLLGAAHRGQLVFAGYVTPKLSDNESKQLAKMLIAVETQRPFIPIQESAHWVQAKYTCRVSFGKQSKDGRLHAIEWDKMLGSIVRR
jgi:ATP dependent DNA ligase C terminal region